MGAKVAYGSLDKKMEEENLKDGCFFYPMVLENIPENSPAELEELFGPVFSFWKFEKDEEAIDIANSSCYGLSGAIFTKNIERGKEMAN